MGSAASVSRRSLCAAAAHLSSLSMPVLPFLRPTNIVCIGTRGGIIHNQVLLHRFQIEAGGATSGIMRRCSSGSPSPSAVMLRFEHSSVIGERGLGARSLWALSPPTLAMMSRDGKTMAA